MTSSDLHPVQPARATDDPYASDVAADEPVGHWRTGPGRLVGVQHEDTLELTAEMWVEDEVEGLLLGYTEPRGRCLRLSHRTGQGLRLHSVWGDEADIGVVLDGSPHHLALLAEGNLGEVRVLVDGRVVYHGRFSGDWSLLGGGELVAGPVEEVAWFERMLPPSRLLGRALVRRGQRPARRPWTAHPLRFRPQGGHAAGIASLCFSPDGRQLVSVDRAGHAVVWDVRTFTTLRELEMAAHLRPSFSADGRYLVATTWRGAVEQALDLDSGESVVVDAGLVLPEALERTASGLMLEGDVACQGRLAVRGPGFRGPIPRFHTVHSQGGVEVRDQDGALRGRVELPGREIVRSEVDDYGTRIVVAHRTPTPPEEDEGQFDISLEAFRIGADEPESTYESPLSSSLRWWMLGHGAVVGVEDVDREDFEMSALHVWDLQTGELTGSMAAPSADMTTSFAVGPERILVACGGEDGGLGLYKLGRPDRADFGLMHGVDGTGYHPTDGVAFSGDGSRLLVEGRDVSEFDLATLRGVELGRRPRSTDPAFAEATSRGRLQAAVQSDGTVQLVATDTGASVTLAVKDTEWVCFMDDGTFDASPEGVGLLAASRGPRAFAVDQIAVRYNRPDLILERMGLGTGEHREGLRQAHQRRVDRHGGVPELDDVPRARMAIERQVGGTLDISCVLTDRVGLSRYQVFVDGVGVFPDGGWGISGRRIRDSATVTLTDTHHHIELATWNERGQESMRDLLFAAAEEPVRRRSLYFVGVGVSRYHSDRIPDLAWAHRDVLDLAELLGRGHPRFDAIHVVPLVDEQVTRGSVEALRAHTQATSHEDELILFVAGHGVYDETGTWYLLVHDTDPEDLPGTAVSYDALEDLLDAIPARRKLVFMDACQSGELFEEAATILAPGDDGRGLRARVVPGGALPRRARPVRTRSSPRRWLFERDRFIYRDLRRRTGAIVLSSCRGWEASWESAELQNGAFTEAILEALCTDLHPTSPPKVLDHHDVFSAVVERVPELTRGRQHPTIDRDNLRQGVDLPVFAR